MSPCRFTTSGDSLPGQTAISSRWSASCMAYRLPPGLGKRTLLLDYPTSGLPAPQPQGASLELQVALRPPGATLDDIQPLVGAELPGYSSLAPRRCRLRHIAADRASRYASGGRAAGVWAARGRRRPRRRPICRRSLLRGCGPPISIRGCASPRDWAAKSSDRTRTATSKKLGGRSAMCSARTVSVGVPSSRWPPAQRSTGNGSHRFRQPIWSPRPHPFTRVCSSARILRSPGRLRQSPVPPSIASVEYRRVTRARGSLPGATAWHASVGPAVLASRSADAQPLKVAVAHRHHRRA